MLKKSLIGLVIIALSGFGYIGISKYQNYQRQEKARLIQERNRDITRRYIEIQKEEQKKTRIG